MSLTVSRGLTDAGRWTTMATMVVEHLNDIEYAVRVHREPPPPPLGAYAAAKQFFTLVLNGIARDQHKSRGGRAASVGSNDGTASAPTMAGISNLSIAVNVLSSAGGKRRAHPNQEDLEQLQKQIVSLCKTLDEISAR